MIPIHPCGLSWGFPWEYHEQGLMLNRINATLFMSHNIIAFLKDFCVIGVTTVARYFVNLRSSLTLLIN